VAAGFVVSELRGPGFSEAGQGLRPDARMAALARFEPPDEALLGGALGGGEAGFASPAVLPPLSPDDRRELAAARASLDAGRHEDGARLLEDLTGRHPRRGGLRLLMAYAFAMAGESEKAWQHYRIADEQGMGPQACWGLANACLRIGDIACARRELADHVLARRPDDEDALDLLTRITAARGRASRSLPL
jgi:thioredoxin-like negative regulator of GroEL